MLYSKTKWYKYCDGFLLYFALQSSIHHLAGYPHQLCLINESHTKALTSLKLK
jgi:hypothetical protein